MFFIQYVLPAKIKAKTTTTTIKMGVMLEVNKPLLNIFLQLTVISNIKFAVSINFLSMFNILKEIEAIII